METQTNTPVGIVQELLAIYATRKEAAERISAKFNGQQVPGVAEAATQSQEFITALMGELSNFGDGVQAGVDRDNAYLQLWKSALPKVDSWEAAEATQVFQQMEAALRQHYTSVLETNTALPETLSALLQKQSAALSR